MKIADIIRHDRHLDVVWADGSRDQYHFVWLRDHMPDQAFFDPQTGERLIDTYQYIDAASPESISIEGTGDLLAIKWPERREVARYDAQWLAANSYSEARRSARGGFLPPSQLWPWQAFSDVPRHAYQGLTDDPSRATALLHDFKKYGFAFIEGAPAEEGVVAAMTEWLGYTREVAFGLVREIRSEPETLNVAFTSRLVKPHIDGTNYIYPYEVQFLHCITNEAEGGDSQIVDGYGAVEKLRDADPAAFEVLTRVEVDYVIGAGTHDIRHAAPVIECNREGDVSIVRYSNAQRRVLSVAFEDVEPFYAAYGALSRLVNDPANQLQYRFKPGDVLMFDNHRTLHARGAFKPETGRRHLQLATTDRDMVDSMLRRLARVDRSNVDIASLLPETPNANPS